MGVAGQLPKGTARKPQGDGAAARAARRRATPAGASGVSGKTGAAARLKVAAGKGEPTPALSPAITLERRQLMNALESVVQMLGGIVGHHIEVVLHDLTHPESSLVAIANGHVSNRQVGDSILSGPKDDLGFGAAREELSKSDVAVHSIVDDYPTLSRSGQRLKSSTVVFRDSAGKPYAALCLNADLTMIEATHAWLGLLLHPHGAAPPAREEPPEMDTLMKEIISDAVRRTGKPMRMMGKEEKIQAVQAMMQRGLFIVKGGVERAAGALGVSRFTIYNYLEALRMRNGEGTADAPGAIASKRP